MADFHTTDELDPGQRLLVRIDVNAPIEDGEVQSTRRFERHAESIRELLDAGHALAIMAHQGRPGRDTFTTLEQHAFVLSDLVGEQIEYVPSTFGEEAVEAITDLEPNPDAADVAEDDPGDDATGDAILLENVRMVDGELPEEPPEVKAQTDFVRTLANAFDAYVNDGYSVAHRSHASIVGFPEVMDAYAGPVMADEYEYNTSVERREFDGDVTMVLGGTKAEDVIAAMDNLEDTVDTFLLGGVVGDRIPEADARRFYRAVDDTFTSLQGDGGTTGHYDADLRLDFEYGTETRTLDIRLAPFRNGEREKILVVARDVTERHESQRRLGRERDALRKVQTVMADETLDTDERLTGLLEIGARTLDLDIGIVSAVEGDEYAVRTVYGPEADIEPGDCFDLESTYCEMVLGQDSVCSFADAPSAGMDSHPAYTAFDLHSYIGVPLVVNGERYGTLNFSSPEPRVDSFQALERTFVELLAELVSTELFRGRHRAELERQQFLFDQVQETADIGIWEYDVATETLRWSDGVRRIHGLDAEYEPSLTDALDFYHPDDVDDVTAAIDRAIEDGEPYDLDSRIVRADGEVREVRAWGQPVTNARHEAPLVRGVLQDVTTRNEREREHRRLAEEYDALLSNSGDAIFLLDVDSAHGEMVFRFGQLSPGYETQTGLSTEVVRGKTPSEVFGDDRGAELAANYRHCVESREPITYQEELAVADDARYWQTSLAPVIIDDEIVRIVGIARNVTERVERERELEQTNQRLESLIDAAPLTIMEIDPDGNVQRWNNGAEEMFGWTRDEVVGEFNPMIQDDRQSEFATHRERVLNGDRIRGKEIERETSEGERLTLLLSAAPVEAPGGEVSSIIAILDDITEQKRLENRLRALQETAQALSEAQSKAEIGELAVDAAADVLGFHVTGIWEYDEHEDALVPITETPAARELFGTSPRYTPGDSLAWEAFESDELRAADDVLSEGDPYNSDTQIRSEILAPLGEYGLISTGSTVEADFSELEVDLFRILAATVEAALGRASREAELRQQNERLDQFASVVAHDLRNPLSVAEGFLDVAEQTNEPAHFERVASAHDRIERLVDDLLTLARGEPTVEDTEQIDIERVATEAWGYVDTSAATLSVDDVPVVAGDSGRLTQLFENLFRNAIEHGGTDVTITVGATGDDGGFYVADDGVGIPPEKRDDIFEHGFTTNDGGTGFGLSIVADIARAHGWTVSLDGGDGGAHFRFERTG
mgnify:CR=1 FL=1